MSIEDVEKILDETKEAVEYQHVSTLFAFTEIHVSQWCFAVNTIIFRKTADSRR